MRVYLLRHEASEQGVMSTAHGEVGSLGSALAYENEDVVDRFADQWNLDRKEVESLFAEVRKFLWLCARRTQVPDRPALPADIRLIGRPELRILDELWHTFVLFTRDYQEFCETHLGGFVHHMPTTRAERVDMERRWEDDPEGEQRRAIEEYRAVLLLVAEELGEKTLDRWFFEIPARFPAERLDELKRRAPSGG